MKMNNTPQMKVKPLVCLGALIGLFSSSVCIVVIYFATAYFGIDLVTSAELEKNVASLERLAERIEHNRDNLKKIKTRLDAIIRDRKMEPPPD
jgi:hypothetical protein